MKLTFLGPRFAPSYTKIPKKKSFHEDFKDLICALAEQICTVKTSNGSQIIPKICLHKLRSQLNYHTLPVTPFKDL